VTVGNVYCYIYGVILYAEMEVTFTIFFHSFVTVSIVSSQHGIWSSRDLTKDCRLLSEAIRAQEASPTLHSHGPNIHIS
jgi:hypothetical protein